MNYRKKSLPVQWVLILHLRSFQFACEVSVDGNCTPTPYPCHSNASTFPIGGVGEVVSWSDVRKTYDSDAYDRICELLNKQRRNFTFFSFKKNLNR